MMAMVTEPTVYKLAPRALARGRLETGKDGPAGIYPAGPTSALQNEFDMARLPRWPAIGALAT
jgi:hypothetical protein